MDMWVYTERNERKCKARRIIMIGASQLCD